MNPKLNCKDVIEIVKNDFGALWNCRQRGNSLEIITPFSTTTQKFVSVFVTIRDGAYIVTDGGWLRGELDLYEIPEIDDVDCDLHVEFFSDAFGIRTYISGDTGEKFFYKKAANEKLLSNAVYDLGNFLSSVVNGLSLPRQEKQELEHKETFRGLANNFVSVAFPHQANFRYKLEGLKTVTFSAAIVYSSKLSVVTYVTGSRANYFSTDLKRAIINFELTAKSRYNELMKSKVALLNDEAEGYSAIRNEELMPLLEEHGASAVRWTERERLKEIL